MYHGLICLGSDECPEGVREQLPYALMPSYNILLYEGVREGTSFLTPSGHVS
jgi:hypothetical protein